MAMTEKTSTTRLRMASLKLSRARAQIRPQRMRVASGEQDRRDGHDQGAPGRRMVSRLDGRRRPGGHAMTGLGMAPPSMRRTMKYAR